MNRFAHLSDIHLGVHRDPLLQKIELKIFNELIDKCIELNVDFIIISGDFFHIGIPDLGVVNNVLKMMQVLKKEDIPIYVIYGSHDYSPIGTTIIDLLDTVGSIEKIEKFKTDGKKLKVEFKIDLKTGAKIAGISGRKRSLESRNYEVLDRKSLEKEDGFKIFAFHSGLAEFKPTYLSENETISLKLFPKNFNYYAGGHIHERAVYSSPGYDKIVFPGPLFTGYGKDIEETAKGLKRGFYLVSFDDEVRDIDFIEVKSFESAFLEYNVSDKNAIEVKKDLKDTFRKLDAEKKVIAIRIFGELSGGKPSDIDFISLKQILIERGALYVHLNRYGLSSRESTRIPVEHEDIASIENNLFIKNLGSVNLSQELLKGDKALGLATDLLRILRQEIRVNESKKDYLNRILESGKRILKLSKYFGEIDFDNKEVKP